MTEHVSTKHKCCDLYCSDIIFETPISREWDRTQRGTLRRFSAALGYLPLGTNTSDVHAPNNF